MLNIDGMPLITDNHGGKGRSRVETGLPALWQFSAISWADPGF